MKLVWIIGVTFNLIASIYAGPVEVVYNGDGCDCQSRLSPSYQAPLPTYPLSPPYKLTNYGYKIDAPQVQTKAKVTYTFDFIVEEPKPTYAKKPKKLNLHAKVDRIALNKPDCTDSYISQPPPPPPPPLTPPQETYAPSQCSYGSTKPLYRYVDEQVVQPCSCRCPTCKCHLQSPDSISIGNPVLVASGSSHEGRTNSRRKRDLEQIFFRPRRQDRVRSTRYIKLYKKPINDKKEKENWFDLDFFSDARPLKRYSKRSLHPDFRSKMVKRDIKGEYDLLEKERQEADLTLPEIIQYMPETLRPNFKRGSCQFGCARNLLQSNSESRQADEKDKIFFEINRRNNEIEKQSTSRTPSISGDNDNNEPENAKADNSFAKRNANDFRQYQTALHPTTYSDMGPQLNDYNANIPIQSSNEQQKLSSAALCKQRNLYSAMSRSVDSQYNYGGDEGYKYVPNPPPLIAAPEPLLGAPKYPVQYLPNGSLDRIISDIVNRHPGFIEASSHYGGGLVDPTSEQVEQTKGYIKKLIDGRFGLLFGKSEEPYTALYPRPSYGGPSYNSNIYPRPMSYTPNDFY